MNNKIIWINGLNPAITSPNGIIIYGAGLNTARLIANFRHDHPQVNILCIADADINKQNNVLMGVPIVSPKSISAKYDKQTCVIVTPSKYCIAITEKLNELGFFNLLYYTDWDHRIIKECIMRKELRARNRNTIDRLLSENEEKISFVRQLLEHDEKSLAVFNAKLNSTYFGEDISLEAIAEGDLYFPIDIIQLSKSEVFVDCGTLDGGTTLDFIRRAGKYDYIYAFEPDVFSNELTKIELDFQNVKNYDLYNLGVYDKEGEMKFKMVDTGGSHLTELDFQNAKNYDLYNWGVYDKEGEMKFKMVDTGGSHLTDDGDMVIQVTSLDALLYEKSNRPTFIKMDIEGAELKALCGARKIIERDKPKLAICAYHGHDHIWEIPYWIKTNFPDYKIYFRQHQNVFDTLCYAIV